MFQNPDAWLVLLSLAVTAVAVILWLREAGDDWLRRDADGRWNCTLQDFTERSQRSPGQQT